jgi:membrane protein involved in colicin uptake
VQQLQLAQADKDEKLRDWEQQTRTAREQAAQMHEEEHRHQEELESLKQINEGLARQLSAAERQAQEAAHTSKTLREERECLASELAGAKAERECEREHEAELHARLCSEAHRWHALLLLENQKLAQELRGQEQHREGCVRCQQRVEESSSAAHALEEIAAALETQMQQLVDAAALRRTMPDMAADRCCSSSSTTTTDSGGGGGGTAAGGGGECESTLKERIRELEAYAADAQRDYEALVVCSEQRMSAHLARAPATTLAWHAPAPSLARRAARGE